MAQATKGNARQRADAAPAEEGVLVRIAIGFTTWAYALARTTSGKMGATTYAVPGLVVLMSWLILGQVPRWLTIAGGALCLAGVAVSRSRPGRRAAPAPPVTTVAEGQRR